MTDENKNLDNHIESSKASLKIGRYGVVTFSVLGTGYLLGQGAYEKSFHKRALRLLFAEKIIKSKLILYKLEEYIPYIKGEDFCHVSYINKLKKSHKEAQSLLHNLHRYSLDDLSEEAKKVFIQAQKLLDAGQYFQDLKSHPTHTYNIVHKLNEEGLVTKALVNEKRAIEHGITQVTVKGQKMYANICQDAHKLFDIWGDHFLYSLEKQGLLKQEVRALFLDKMIGEDTPINYINKTNKINKKYSLDHIKYTLKQTYSNYKNIEISLSDEISDVIRSHHSIRNLKEADILKTQEMYKKALQEYIAETYHSKVRKVFGIKDVKLKPKPGVVVGCGFAALDPWAYREADPIITKQKLNKLYQTSKLYAHKTVSLGKKSLKPLTYVTVKTARGVKAAAMIFVPSPDPLSLTFDASMMFVYVMEQIPHYGPRNKKDIARLVAHGKIPYSEAVKLLYGDKKMFLAHDPEMEEYASSFHGLHQSSFPSPILAFEDGKPYYLHTPVVLQPLKGWSDAKKYQVSLENALREIQEQKQLLLFEQKNASLPKMMVFKIHPDNQVLWNILKPKRYTLEDSIRRLLQFKQPEVLEVKSKPYSIEMIDAYSAGFLTVTHK